MGCVSHDFAVPSGAMVERVRVGSSAQVKEGRSILVDAFGRKVAIFRVQGRLRAIDDVCPHRGGPLSDGDVEDGMVFCPLHAWAFDLETGMMRGNPSCRVPVYPVMEEDGEVYLLPSSKTTLPPIGSDPCP